MNCGEKKGDSLRTAHTATVIFTPSGIRYGTTHFASTVPIPVRWSEPMEISTYHTVPKA